MAQEIEIEYKALLTKEQFDRLATALPFPAAASTQTNYYFETKQFDLKKQNSALRIRKKDNAYALTLKQPHTEGILETHDSLSEKEFLSWMNGKPFSAFHVGNKLEKMGINANSLLYYGLLTTERRSFKSDHIEYVLDESKYNGTIDYELEIEAPSKEIGEAAFEQLLAQFNIEPKEPITKIERFFNTL